MRNRGHHINYGMCGRTRKNFMKCEGVCEKEELFAKKRKKKQNQKGIDTEKYRDKVIRQSEGNTSERRYDACTINMRSTN